MITNRRHPTDGLESPTGGGRLTDWPELRSMSLLDALESCAEGDDILRTMDGIGLNPENGLDPKLNDLIRYALYS